VLFVENGPSDQQLKQDVISAEVSFRILFGLSFGDLPLVKSVMAYVQANTLFPHQTPQYWTPPPTPVQEGIAWGPLLLTLCAACLVAYASSAFDAPAVRQCGTCGRTGHDTRTCSQNPTKRVRLRITKLAGAVAAIADSREPKRTITPGRPMGRRAGKCAGPATLSAVMAGTGRTWVRIHAIAGCKASEYL
jgi:hypothetical protein